MNYVILLTVLCAAIGLSEQGLTKEEVDQMFEEFLAECAKKEGGTADDIIFIRDRHLPVKREQDCMVACIGENFALVEKGRILVDKVIKLANSVLASEPRKIEIITTIATECEDGGDPDRCVAAHNTYDCALKSAARHNFKLEDFI